MTATAADVRPDRPSAAEDPPAPLPALRPNWLLIGTIVFSAAVALAWIVAGVRSAGRGLNVADESFYLLSYRWWDTHHRNFTGVQYLYGPVFELLGHHIAGLRLFRLGSVVAVHAVFGWSFMRWLRARRPAAAPSRLWEAAGVATIVAAGGVACGWLPLSPGYNDVAVLGALLAMSFVLFAAGHADLGRPIPARLGVGYGVVVPFLLLAKWSSVVAVVLTAATAVAVLGGRSPRELARLLGGVAGGAAIGLLFLQTFTSVAAAVRGLIGTNRVIMASSVEPPTATVERYAGEVYRLVYATVDRYGLLLFAAAVAVAVSWLPAIRLAAGVVSVAALGLAVQDVMVTDSVQGGAGHTGGYVRTLTAALIVVVWIALLVVDGERVRLARWSAGRSRSGEPPLLSALGAAPRTWVVLGALVLLPMVQALGTTGGLMGRAIGGFAAWMAVMIAVFTGIERASAVARCLTAGVLAATVLAAGSAAIGGLWRNPYRTYPYHTATATATGVPAFESIRFHPATAAALADLRRELRPYVEPAGRAMLGVPALLLALDGRPVGEPWPAGTGVRIASAIRAACPDGRPWWGARPPLLLYPGPVGAAEIRGLRHCGVEFPADYRRLATFSLPTDPATTLEVDVYVPAAELARVQRAP